MEIRIEKTNLPKEENTMIVNSTALLIKSHAVGVKVHSDFEREAMETKEEQKFLMDTTEMKSSIQFLKQVSDLRATGNKEARKEKRNLVSSEIEKEKTNASTFAKSQEQPETVHEPIPCLYDCVNLIVREHLSVVPSAKCAICQDFLLPTDCTSFKKVTRLYCMHWYHYKCIEEVLSNPPFDPSKKVCIVCKKQIKTKKWGEEFFRAMARKYLKQQERERELKDVMDFMS